MADPPDFPDWLDERTVRWCSARCDAVAARSILRAKYAYRGAQMCARHLTQTADLVAAKHLLEALDGGPIESVGEPEVEVDTSDIPEASGVKEKR